MKTAICSGSFDPVTVGHVDIITRASKMFDKIIVAVLNNINKQVCFDAEERVRLIEKATAELANVEVTSFDGLLADFAAQRHATAIVRGLRALSDFEYEFQMALTNNKLNPGLETIFLTTRSENMFISSSIVKQVARYGGDISSFVPECVHDEILNRLRKD